jgi:KaiC/GvpD/RAD55 family RecA-like ATPase
MPVTERLSTGIPQLDEHLGGGLLPGTLTVVCGATGIGKTQFGLHFAQAGQKQESRRGIVFDMTSRGNAQGHVDYAQRIFGWKLDCVHPDAGVDLARLFDTAHSPGDYLHIFEMHGRRVTRADMDTDQWRQWQAEVALKLRAAIAFFYANFIRGVRRVVVDGIEPAARASDSVQLDLFEYLYHQVLRKDADWVARDLLREQFRAAAAEVNRSIYDTSSLACVLLATSHESMLDELAVRPLAEGDVLANANTVIYMGKIRDGQRFGRGLYIAKHRTSAASEDVIPYSIGEQGLVLE